MDPFVEIHRTPANSRVSSGRDSRIWSAKPTGAAQFFGPGTTLRFDRGTVHYPLVYVCRGVLNDFPDASLIESGLPVAPSGAEADELPYWPSYRGATPSQRSRYIDWLISGRCDPEISLGYVFIYFYGLERRVLLDRADYEPIASELLRLLAIYSHSRSFRKYATALLWTSIWLSLKESPVAGELIERALSEASFGQDVLGTCLACFASLQAAVPESLAYKIAESDPATPRSVVKTRHPDLHRQAFQERLRERFPHGFTLKSGNREKALEYFPASATLGRLHATGGPLVNERIPNVLAGGSRLRPLIEIWTAANEDLKAYDRAHRKSGAVQLTGSMYEALPEYLRQGDHPHFEQWYAIMEKWATDDGWTIVPVSEFARLDGHSEGKKLTKSQSMQLAMTASHMGLALEPDPRITGRSYDQDELVSIFPATEELGQDIAAYHAAAVLLELGVAIAAADGEIDELELRRLNSHLEAQFKLSSQDAARLAHLKYLLSRRPPTEFSAARTLQKNLSTKQRRVVGEFLVGIAAADDVIAPPEVKALEKAYRALGLDGSDLRKSLESLTSTGPTTNPADVVPMEFRLDLDRVNSIMAETESVARFLAEALREDFEDTETSAGTAEIEMPQPVSPSGSTVPTVPFPVPAPEDLVVPSAHKFENLDARFVVFATAIIDRDEWSLPEAGDLARKCSLMLGAAIENINDWGYDVQALPDALLIDTGEVIQVQRHLLGFQGQTK